MAACRCTVYLKAIRHVGANLGDDWTFTIKINEEEKVLTGDGQNQDFGGDGDDAPPKWVLDCGGFGEEIALRFFIRAVEEDLIFDDMGSNQRSLHYTCPAEGEEPVVHADQVVRVTVQENRGLFEGGTNRIDFHFEVVIACE